MATPAAEVVDTPTVASGDGIKPAVAAADCTMEAVRGTPKEAYVSLLTSDSFLMAVQALIASLKATGTARRLLLLHTTQVSRPTLARLRGDSFLDLREVAAIPNPHQTDVPGWVNSGFTKLRVWEQVDFDKLVYIDADCVVLERVDELFERPSPAFCPDVFPPDKFNAGVIVLSPSRELFEKMQERIAELPSHDGGDTGFLNAFFPDWYRWSERHRLPFRYNALRTMYWFTHKNPGYWDSLKPIKILHFCSSPKPWDPEAKKGDLEQLWWEHYLRSQVPFLGSFV
mmetsp:Transcript_45158/g.81597  ORF Transcript_45158/g.81597 Transcript_45158/m.81597 type:complete len:285 (-) Transcript_45158:102-956(-)